MNIFQKVTLPIWLTAVLAAGACTPPDQITTRDYNRFALKAQEEKLWREAEYRLRQALELNPKDARLYNNLGVALEAQGKLAEAHAAYEEAVKLAPENEAFRRNLQEFINAHRWEYDAEAKKTEEGEKEQ